MNCKKEIDELSVKMMSLNINSNDYTERELLEEMKKVIDLNAKGRDGRTLLIHAALYNKINIVKWLLKNGADIGAQCNMGLTPLHAAVISNSSEIVALLLQFGADVNARDTLGNTPLLRATLNVDIIKLLLTNGADISIMNNFGISAIKKFEAYPRVIELLSQKKG